MHELILRGSSVLGMREEIAAEIVQVLNLNPNASEKRSVRHPHEFQRCMDWTPVPLSLIHI